MTTSKTYTAIYDYDDDDNAWNVRIKGLTGCQTYGRSIRQAQGRIREALAVWLDKTPTELGIRDQFPAELASVADDVVRAAALPSRAGAKPATDHRGSQNIDRPRARPPRRSRTPRAVPTSASTNSSKQAETCVPICRCAPRGREEHVIIDGCVREWCLSPSPPSPRRVRAAGRLRPSDRLSRFGSDWIAASCDRCDHGTASSTTELDPTTTTASERTSTTSLVRTGEVATIDSGTGSGLCTLPLGSFTDPRPETPSPDFVVGSARWIVPDCCNLIVTLQNLEPPMPDWEMTDSFEANGIQWTLYDSGPRDGTLIMARGTAGPITVLVTAQGPLGGHPISRR